MKKKKIRKVGVTDSFIEVRGAVEIVDEEKRLVRFTGSSEHPVERHDWCKGENYLEILSHDPKDVDLSRMSDGGPVLDTHYGDQIAIVESISIKDGKTDILTRFSKVTPRATIIFQDIVDEIRKSVSVGYRKTGIVSSKKEDGKLRESRFAWQPFEVSFVPVPADPTVGVGRDQEAGKRELDFETEIEVEDKIKPKTIILT